MVSYYFSRAIFRVLRRLNLGDTRWQLMRRFPIVFFYPCLERQEYMEFRKLCRDKKVFLEFGSGGSTIYLLQHHKTVFSVESNPDFFRYMCSIGMIKKAINVDLLYRFVDLGATNKWGKPLSKKNCESWSVYYEKIWEDIDPQSNRVDVIFIDGRFRVCCCLYSVVKLIEYDWKDTIFVIHDFWRRTEYHVLLDFLKEIRSKENLVSFSIKKNIDITGIQELMDEYSLATV